MVHKDIDKFHGFSGNYLFASAKSCQGFSKSRRDDIESILYLLIFLLNDNYLPWQINNGKFDLQKLLRERNLKNYYKQLFDIIDDSKHLYYNIYMIVKLI